jgi:outer membrane protein TolC
MEGNRMLTRTRTAACVAFLLLTGLLQAQIPAGSPAGDSPFLGSIPQGTASGEEIPLSLAEAIARGLRYNLGPRLSDASARAARGARFVALSGLLPNIVTKTSESSQQINLASLGFTGFPGIAPVIGPFGVSDGRAHLSQAVLDLRSIRTARAASEDVKAAEYSSLDARDTVVLVVTDLYLQAQAGASRVDASRAQVATAEAVYRQAVDFKRNGVVPAIDVLRAQVELEAQQQRLIFFNNEFQKQELILGRAIGLPDGQPLRLTDEVPFTPMPPSMTLEEARARALATRRDYQSALAGVCAAELGRKAAEAERLPSLDFTGDYGATGPTLANSHGTYTAALSLTIPVFQGGRVRGEVLEADALLEQRRAQLADLRGRIAFELRTAFLDVGAAGEQVRVARNATGLAQEQLRQAQDRFAAGVTDNLEVIQAQEAVATASENYISSLYAYNAAKAALGRAIGETEKTIPSFLQGVMP